MFEPLQIGVRDVNFFETRTALAFEAREQRFEGDPKFIDLRGRKK